MIGVDEVGRGCLAGPLLVVAARQIDKLPKGLHDSKLMSREQRLKTLDLLSNCCNFGEGWVTATEIDKYGLSKALRLGLGRALKAINAKTSEEIIMDGKTNYIAAKFKKTRCIVDADNLIPIVSAASIYAKVTRDRFMFKLAKKHPTYYFEKHVGYGTKLHMKALEDYGVIRLVHRKSYKPIARLMIART